jgi:L-cysteine:1D-myo-inositol 2-amino-2-deoxy-alpha-D-glucopyranoside ligase
MAIRWALMSDHYRSDRMWSDLVLHNAQGSISRLGDALAKQSCAPTEALINSIVLAISDDLNTPLAISNLNQWSAETLLGSHGGNAEDLKLTLDALLGIKF